jgi:hypothetical protein
MFATCTRSCCARLFVCCLQSWTAARWPPCWRPKAPTGSSTCRVRVRFCRLRCDARSLNFRWRTTTRRGHLRPCFSRRRTGPLRSASRRNQPGRRATVMRMPSSADGATGPEPGQSGLAAVSLRGPLRDARYSFIVSVPPCDSLGAESVRDSSWTRNAATCLPTSQSRFAVEFLSGRRCVLSRRRPPPPESRGRPCPLCGRTTSCLPDALSALPRRATQRRPLDFGALPACSLPCRLQVLPDVRHLERGLELLTGLHPPPGAARLEL